MVISRTPLRVSLVGGGSDISAFADRHGGAVVSATIDKYIYVIVTRRFEPDVRASYSVTEIVDSIDALEHELLREALRAADVRSHAEVVTIADVPARGSGLGSSSAVTVGALNALFAYRGITKGPADLAAEASRIEIDVLGKPIGRQDQYACAFGGLQFMRFGPDGEVQREPLAVPASTVSEIEQNLLVFYTGRGRNASDLLRPLADGLHASSTTREAMVATRDLALRLRDELTSGGSADVVGSYLRESWRMKRDLNPGASDAAIDGWHELALEAGAIGGKLLGAGGGGFLLFYVPENRHGDVREALGDLRELDVRFESEGSRIVQLSA